VLATEYFELEGIRLLFFCRACLQVDFKGGPYRRLTPLLWTARLSGIPHLQSLCSIELAVVDACLEFPDKGRVVRGQGHEPALAEESPDLLLRRAEILDGDEAGATGAHLRPYNRVGRVALLVGREQGNVSGIEDRISGDRVVPVLSLNRFADRLKAG